MKKLLLLLTMLISVASFAAPTVRIDNTSAWDKPLHAKPMKFTDPYTVDYWALVGGSPTQLPYYLQLYAELNTSTSVRWDVILEVYGKWDALGGSYGFKQFTITIPAGQQFKLVNFTLGTNEIPDPNWVNYVSEGPH